jgi:hypothetical protein
MPSTAASAPAVGADDDAVRDEAEVRKQVRKVLQRRATAKRRSGLSYRVCELVDPGGWLSPKMTRGKQTCVK